MVLVVLAFAATLLPGTASGQDEQEPEEPSKPGPAFAIEGSGEGHGVGLSQWGARALAREGRTYQEILQHFYAGVDVGAVEGDVPPLQVGLFHNNPRVENDEVLALSALRDGESAGVDVSLDGGESVHRVTGGQTWTLAWEEGGLLVPAGFVLRDTDGDRVDRAGGPVTISFATGDEPALRLPQIARSGEAREGALAHGELTVTRVGETLQLLPVLELDVEEYLRGVDEMPALWNPTALEAQAVAARTYAVRRARASLRASCGCHVGVTAADQVYAGWAQEGDPQRAAWTEAVEATGGVVVTHEGALIDAVYSAAHAGRSENVEDSWAFAGEPVPYLRSVPDPWISDSVLADAYPRASWRHEFDHAALAAVAQLEAVTEVRISGRTDGGTPRQLTVSGWGTDGQRVEGRQVGGDDVAGAALYRVLVTLGDAPPSQQFGTIGFAAFDDVDDESPHAYNVAAVAAEGIAQGTGPRTYSPRDGVRRDQMASFIARALDLPLDPGAPNRFDDVPAGSVHRDAINAVAAAGIAQGVGPRRYAPGATVTRDQMASFLARAFDLGERQRDRFSDIGESVHRTRINAVADAEITTGCTSTRYCPRLPVTRDQMASFLARALGYGW